MSIRDKVLKRLGIGYLCYGGLGFYRGLEEDTFNYNQKMHNKPADYISKHPQLYSKQIGNGLFGSLLYFSVFPLAFITIPKELYRLEVNLRGLEKTKKYYSNY